MHKHWASTPQPSAVLFCLLANEARTKQGEFKALVVKGHTINLWYRLKALPGVPLVVHRRYLIEEPSPLPAAPLVVRRIVLWTLRSCALWVLNRGAQADARPAVRAHASNVKKECRLRSLRRTPTPCDNR
jgi:hypothetical protein